MHYLVFDVGGSAIKYALMDETAAILQKGEQPTPADSLERFLGVIEAIYGQYQDVDGIALSLPGRIDSEQGYAYSGGHLLYNSEKNIARLISERCGVRVSVENDGKCAALAEAWKGSLADCDDGIVVVLGTGIGGGIIKNRAVHKGKEYTAGEFSFIIANTDLKKGQKLTVFAEQCGVPYGLCHPVAALKGLPVGEVDGRTVFALANRGDQQVLAILDEYCYKLALQLFNLQHIYNPEKIAIGGGISAQDILMKYLQDNLDYVAGQLEVKLSTPKVVRCKFRNDANLVGALRHFKTLYEASSQQSVRQGRTSQQR